MNRRLMSSLVFLLVLCIGFVALSQEDIESNPSTEGILIMKLDNVGSESAIEEQLINNLRLTFGEKDLAVDSRAGEFSYQEMSSMAECAGLEDEECRSKVALFSNTKEYVYGQLDGNKVRLVWYHVDKGVLGEGSREVFSAGDSQLLSLELIYGPEKAAEIFSNISTRIVYLPLYVEGEDNAYRHVVEPFESHMKEDLRSKHFHLDESEDRPNLGQVMLNIGCSELSEGCYRDIARFAGTGEFISGTLDEAGVMSLVFYSAKEGLIGEIKQLVHNEEDAKRISEKLILGDMGDLLIKSDRGAAVLVDDILYGFVVEEGSHLKLRLPIGEFEVKVRKPGYLSYGPIKVNIQKDKVAELSAELEALGTHPLKKVYIGLGSGLLGVGVLSGIFGALAFLDSEKINNFKLFSENRKKYRDNILLFKPSSSSIEDKGKFFEKSYVKGLHKKAVTTGAILVGTGSALVVTGTILVMYGALNDFYGDGEHVKLGYLPVVNFGFNRQGGAFEMGWHF